jgi:hypothetical protein
VKLLVQDPKYPVRLQLQLRFPAQAEGEEEAVAVVVVAAGAAAVVPQPRAEDCYRKLKKSPREKGLTKRQTTEKISS